MNLLCKENSIDRSEVVPTDAEFSFEGLYAAVKRPSEVVLSLLLMIITAPIALLAVLLVKFTSQGPAFYSQMRLGRNGVSFRIFKIRTMTQDCERSSGAIWAVRNDPRVFPVGRILRTLHVDELPQLFNVLRGDMSLIGPRPERPNIAFDIVQDIPGYADRLAMRPGVSGLAQVQFPADTDLGSVCRKLVADIQYVRAVSPALDLRIAIATILHLFHLPYAWRRVILGDVAESAPLSEPTTIQERLAAVYEIPQKPNRIVAVQGLRGVAASLVFLTHFLTLFGINLGGAMNGFAATAVDSIARNGTDFYLMISGFLIYGMCMRRSLDYRRFLRDRMCRIYPAFLCVFALYLMLSLAFPAESKIPAAPLAAALFILENLALLPGLTGSPAMIVVTWTLGYELLLYVSLPLIIRFTGMRNWPAGLRVAALLAVWAAYMVFCGIECPGHVRLSFYFAAFLAYEAIHRRKGSLSKRLEVLAMLAVAMGIGLVVLLRTKTITISEHTGLMMALRVVAVTMTLFAVAWCCFGGIGMCSRVLSWTPLRWLGNMSYSFYLTHGLVLKAAAMFVASLAPAELLGPGLFWIALPFCYLGALSIATILFLAVEKRLSFSAKPEPILKSGEEDDHGSAETVTDLQIVQETGIYPVIRRTSTIN